MPFKKGQGGKGRGKSAAIELIRAEAKQASWEMLRNVVEKMFKFSMKELKEYIEANKHLISKGEYILLTKCETPMDVHAILDRIIGRPTQMEITDAGGGNVFQPLEDFLKSIQKK